MELLYIILYEYLLYMAKYIYEKKIGHSLV